MVVVLRASRKKLPIVNAKISSLQLLGTKSVLLRTLSKKTVFSTRYLAKLSKGVQYCNLNLSQYHKEVIVFPVTPDLKKLLCCEASMVYPTIRLYWSLTGRGHSISCRYSALKLNLI